MGTPKSTIPLLLLCIFLLSTCKEKDCHKTGECPPEYYRIRLGEAKNYLYSLPGSYWIYKNTSTGQLDTQVCTGFVFDSIIVKGSESYSKHVTVEYDVIKRSIESTFNHWVYFDQTGNHNPDGASYNNGRNILSRTKGGFIIPFFHPFHDGVQSGTGSSVSTCKGMVNSMTIQGKTYSTVAKIDIDKDDIWEEKLNCIRAHDVYYWGKDVGLIKKEMVSCGYSWELVDYKINR